MSLACTADKHLDLCLLMPILYNNIGSGCFCLPGEMLQQTETLNFVALQKEVTFSKDEPGIDNLQTFDFLSPCCVLQTSSLSR